MLSLKDLLIEFNFLVYKYFNTVANKETVLNVF